MSGRREPEDLGGQYEFEVGVEDGWGMTPATRYVVRLPHQCSYWVIADSGDKAGAIVEMETFLAEAQAALEKLKATP